MSNQAPPDLIRDSLNAAMDELNHTAQHPAWHTSSIRACIRKNLTALALATAREGCIAETFSATETAMEVDRAAANIDEVSTMLMRKTKTIALEEGRHSALAWSVFTLLVFAFDRIVVAYYFQ
jgi:hypothetical protein